MFKRLLENFPYPTKVPIGWKMNIFACTLPQRKATKQSLKVNSRMNADVLCHLARGRRGSSRQAARSAEPRAHGGAAEEQPVLIQPGDGSAGCSGNQRRGGRSVKSPTPGGSFCAGVCSWCRGPTASRPAVLPRRLRRLALRLHGLMPACLKSARIHLCSAGV